MRPNRLFPVLFVILLAAPLSGCIFPPGREVTLDTGPTGFIRKTIVGGADQRAYALFIPANYPENPTIQYPTIIFLHDFVGTGGDLSHGLAHGLAPFVQIEKQSFPYIVIFPHLRSGRLSDADNDADVMAELDAVSADYRIDPDRVSISGVGTGGQSAWMIGATHHERFAAVVPMA